MQNIVSLGPCCAVANTIRDSGLRTTAYPFDWMFSYSTPGVILALKEHGKYHIDATMLEKKVTSCPGVSNTRYGFYMTHDHTDQVAHRTSTGSNDWLEKPVIFEFNRSKYERRWARLINLFATFDGTVNCIRPGLRENDAAELYETLSSLCGPKTKVILHTMPFSTSSDVQCHKVDIKYIDETMVSWKNIEHVGIVRHTTIKSSFI